MRAITTMEKKRWQGNARRTPSSNSDTLSQLDSPLRFHSPIGSDHGYPPDSPPYESPDGSPTPLQFDHSKSMVSAGSFSQLTPLPSPVPPPQGKVSPSSMVVFNRMVRDDPSQARTAKLEPALGGGELPPVVNRSSKQRSVVVAALGFRLSEVVLCLISFSVMAADKTQGWSGDSYDRYKEYRFCLAVNVIAFAYSAFQSCDLACYIAKEKYVINHHLRRAFDFFMDQVLAYLLMSASTAAATRVDDWVSNWGKDEFTQMASASISMSFLAFVAFAFSSLISGYRLCNS